MSYYVTKCNCGAVTVDGENDNHGERYSMSGELFSHYFPELAQETNLDDIQTMYCCDHCVNKYGLDLCACGSGEPYEKCEGGYPECGTPMQSLGERQVSGVEAILNRGSFS